MGKGGEGYSALLCRSLGLPLAGVKFCRKLLTFLLSLVLDVVGKMIVSKSLFVAIWLSFIVAFEMSEINEILKFL